MTAYLASSVWAGASYRITQPWGPTTLTVEPLLNGEHFHCGIDIATPLRTPLFSPVAGKVVHVSYGLWAVTDLVKCYWFVHVDSSVVTLSQWVSKSQLVAYSGNKVPSGGSTTGAHTHVEVQNYPGARTAYYNNFGGLEVPFGALNNPASSLDPVPVLSGRFSAGGGALEDNMTPEEHQWLEGVFKFLSNPDYAKFNEGFRAVLAVLANQPAANNAAVLAAIADLKAHPTVVSDPALSGKIDALAKHLGQGTA